MKLKDIIKTISLIIICIIIFVLYKRFYIFFNNLSKVFIIIGYLVFSFGIIFFDKNNFGKYISFCGYIIILISVLFIREETEDLYSNGNYIFDWIDVIFENEIVFINVIGNILLYMPMTFYLKWLGCNWHFNVICCIMIIIIGEFFQYLFKRGVFDLGDIILNSLGVMIVCIVYGVCICVKKIKKKKIK